MSNSSVAPIHPINTVITPGAINVTTTASVVSSSLAAGDSSNSSVSHVHPIRTYITPPGGSDAASNKQVSNGGSASGLASPTASSGAATSGGAAAGSTSGSKAKSEAANSASPASSAPSKANGAGSLTVAGTVVMVGVAALLF